MSEHLFEDLLVIDCASFIAGPAAATILSDFGARVIKIEPPAGGDGYRLLQYLPGLPKGDTNYPWSLTNRNKESLTLDLKSTEGRELLDQLIRKADVFITNYPLPVRRRLRLGYDDISKINPALIYGSLTPYGEQGPESDRTGYDATAWWARSGLMHTIRHSEDTPPAVSVPGMGDHMTANMLYGAIVTALYKRLRTGEGSQVGTSLMANGIWSNGVMVQAALDDANMDTKIDGSRMSPFTQIYQCGDSRWFILTILGQAEERIWPHLLTCLDREDWLEDNRFATPEARKENSQALKELLQEAFATRSWSEWSTRFDKHGITCGYIAHPADHCDDKQVAAAGVLSEFSDKSSRTIDSPLYVAGEKKRSPSPAPEVGQHSLDILTELGIDADTQRKLIEAGIVTAAAGSAP